jgi:hypothetical protein
MNSLGLVTIGTAEDEVGAAGAALSAGDGAGGVEFDGGKTSAPARHPAIEAPRNATSSRPTEPLMSPLPSTSPGASRSS